MDKLPPEILHSIFIQLSLEQRLLCLTVCRSWWRVLEKYSLFYDVKIEEKNDRFKRMMNMFEQSPGSASQVEELDFAMDFDCCFNERKLLDIFPNARAIKIRPTIRSICSDTRQPDESRITFDKPPIDTIYSKSRVQHISDLYSGELVSQLIYSNLGRRLQTLDLTFIFVPARPVIVSQLKNLPVLKKLSLSRLKINVNDLESLHKNVPSIQDLALNRIIATPHSMPSDIIPATSITKFKFYGSCIRDKDAYIQLYQYMTKKYTYITDIIYNETSLGDYPEDADLRRQVYLEGIFGFLELIGQDLREIDIYGLPDLVNPFKVLDNVGSQIKTIHADTCDGLTIFMYLPLSNQSKYVENLEITNTPVDSIHAIEYMEALTTLKIEFGGEEPPSVNLADILDSCPPTLKTLSICSMNLIVGTPKYTVVPIENLSIESLTFDELLADTVTCFFPDLVTLKLRFLYTEYLVLHIINPLLQEAIIDIGYFNCHDYEYGVSFTCPNITEKQYYRCSRRTKKRTSYEDIEEIPNIAIFCDKEMKLVADSDFRVLAC